MDQTVFKQMSQALTVEVLLKNQLKYAIAAE